MCWLSLIAWRKSLTPIPKVLDDQNTLYSLARRYFKGYDPESDFHPEIRSWHYLAGHFSGMTWRNFYYETPVGVIKAAIAYLNYKQEHGYLNHTEIAMTKVEARKAGMKFDL